MLLTPLPISKDLETIPVLRKAVAAHKALAELKGLVSSIPNGNILIETLTLREALKSSANDIKVQGSDTTMLQKV